MVECYFHKRLVPTTRTPTRWEVQYLIIAALILWNWSLRKQLRFRERLIINAEEAWQWGFPFHHDSKWERSSVGTRIYEKSIRKEERAFCLCGVISGTAFNYRSWSGLLLTIGCYIQQPMVKEVWSSPLNTLAFICRCAILYIGCCIQQPIARQKVKFVTPIAPYRC